MLWEQITTCCILLLLLVFVLAISNFDFIDLGMEVSLSVLNACYPQLTISDFKFMQCYLCELIIGYGMHFIQLVLCFSLFY